MPRHVLLPHPLQRDPFSVKKARLRGLSRSRLRGRDLKRPFPGVRLPPRSTATAIQAFAPRLRPREWFSHESAAQLWLVPLPPWRVRAEQVHVTIAAPGAASRVRGVRGHQSKDTASPRSVVRRFGLPCSDAADTWLGLAAQLSLKELVVAGDHLVLEPEVQDRADPRPYVALAELRARTAEFHGRGKARASAALELVRQGAESRPETLLRLLIRDARLPEPAVNPVIYDATGRIGRADLVFRQHRVIVEYDGDQHRTKKAQYRKDVIRWQRFMRAGWDVLRIHDDGLFTHPSRTIRDITDALTRAVATQSTLREVPQPRQVGALFANSTEVQEEGEG
ncbi:endonuclease domain-containing protein [Subtercola endophyticus]|uniref:endonuclease domain-containing protein n=1 Tax=Subtercola endophyticus TaxID=2895559 RepID=UPI001E3341E9|nr:DUF559 domain-containing protein [Subtercola endophyticus]UFS59452.1 endonuclease domain-containing protein [Subtercola endophyticus]